MSSLSHLLSVTKHADSQELAYVPGASLLHVYMECHPFCLISTMLKFACDFSMIVMPFGSSENTEKDIPKPIVKIANPERESPPAALEPHVMRISVRTRMQGIADHKVFFSGNTMGTATSVFIDRKKLASR